MTTRLECKFVVAALFLHLLFVGCGRSPASPELRRPNLPQFEKYNEKTEVKTEDGILLPGVKGVFYRRSVDGRTESLGIFSHQQKPLFMAWGWADETHCGWNCVADENGEWMEPLKGCPKITPIYENNKIIAFQIKTETEMVRFELE